MTSVMVVKQENVVTSGIYGDVNKCTVIFSYVRFNIWFWPGHMEGKEAQNKYFHSVMYLEFNMNIEEKVLTDLEYR